MILDTIARSAGKRVEQRKQVKSLEQMMKAACECREREGIKGDAIKRAGIMMFSGRFYQFFCCRSKGSYLPFRCCCSYNIIFHVCIPFFIISVYFPYSLAITVIRSLVYIGAFFVYASYAATNFSPAFSNNPRISRNVYAFWKWLS